MEEQAECNHALGLGDTDCVPSIFRGCIRLFDTDYKMYLIVRYEWFTEFPGHVVKQILIREKEIKEDKKINK